MLKKQPVKYFGSYMSFLGKYSVVTAPDSLGMRPESSKPMSLLA